MITRRVALLLIGLALYGVSLAMFVIADLGLAPWDVFHQGLADQLGLSIGTVIVGTSFVVLAMWIPLRERPGIGTLANALLVGLGVDVSLYLLPDEIGNLTIRWSVMLVAVVLNGVATGMYIGAGMGSGPRDGLMTGIARRGYSIRVVRTGLEILVFGIGIVLGGTFGIGTLAYLFGIGPLAHITIPYFTRIGHGKSVPHTPQS